MHRSPHYADSLYYIQKRYEDTSLVIFHQYFKNKRKESKPDHQHQHPSHHQQWSVGPNRPQHLQLPPGVGFNPADKGTKTSALAVDDESSWGAASSAPSSPRIPGAESVTSGPVSPGARSSSSADWPGKGSGTFSSQPETDVASSAGSPTERSRLGSGSSVDPSAPPDYHQGASPPSSPNRAYADVTDGHETTPTNGEVPEFESTRL